MVVFIGVLNRFDLWNIHIVHLLFSVIVEQYSWLNSTAEHAFSIRLKHAYIFSSENGKTNVTVRFEITLKAGNKRLPVISGGCRIAIAISLCIAGFEQVFFTGMLGLPVKEHSVILTLSTWEQLPQGELLEGFVNADA